MAHLATLCMSERSEVRQCGSVRSSIRSEGKVIYSKPRRVAVTNLRSVDFIKPARHMSMSSMAIDGSDPGCEILEIFKSNGEYGCSPPHFSGSPPSRCANPLVRDTRFLHPHVYHPVMATSQVKCPAGTSIRTKPSVRIEGFDCTVRGFEYTGRDAGLRVPAFA